MVCVSLFALRYDLVNLPDLLAAAGVGVRVCDVGKFFDRARHVVREVMKNEDFCAKGVDMEHK
jgi:hypothetical protein